MIELVVANSTSIGDIMNGLLLGVLIATKGTQYLVGKSVSILYQSICFADIVFRLIMLLLLLLMLIMLFALCMG